MKASGAGSVAQGVRGLSVRNLLIVGETALALVLLVAAGLMLQSVNNLQRTALGFEPEGLMTFPLSLPRTNYDEARSTRFFVDCSNACARSPACSPRRTASARRSPAAAMARAPTFPDKPPVAPGQEPSIGVHWASPDLFKTMGIQLVRGRTFTDRDREGQPKVVVINETAARTLFGGEDPIGQKIGLGQGGFHDGAEVIGIVRDVRYRAVEQLAAGGHVRPAAAVVARQRHPLRAVDLDPAALIPAVRAGDPHARPRPAGDQRQDDGDAVRGRDVADASQRGFARALRGAGAAARGDRSLRRDGAGRRAAHARDRRAHGARRRTPQHLHAGDRPRARHRRASASPSASDSRCCRCDSSTRCSIR